MFKQKPPPACHWCHFVQRLAPSEHVCRRLPPVQDGVKRVGHQPGVQPRDWCGEFKPDRRKLGDAR